MIRMHSAASPRIPGWAPSTVRTVTGGVPHPATEEPYETLGGCLCDRDGDDEFDGHAETCPAAPCACPEAAGSYGEPTVRHTSACLSRF